MNVYFDIYLDGPTWDGVDLYAAASSVTLLDSDTSDPTPFTLQPVDMNVSPHDPSVARVTADPYYSGDPLYWCGDLVSMQAAWCAFYPANAASQPNGPITFTFNHDGAAAYSTSTLLDFRFSNTFAGGFSPADPGGTSQEDRLTITALNADGSDRDGPVTLADNGYTYTGIAYGFRLEHTNPGEYSPASWGLGGIVADIFPAATGPTFLRLHQSPVRTPSRVRPIQLRQRQRPELIT